MAAVLQLQHIVHRSSWILHSGEAQLLHCCVHPHRQPPGVDWLLELAGLPSLSADGTIIFGQLNSAAMM